MSLVGTTTNSVATSNPFQLKSFYANGLFWVFYSDGANMVYCTSVDGIAWTAPAIIRASVGGYNFSVWLDGTFLHYAYSTYGVANMPLLYRRGTLNSDGTISWSAVEQTAVAAVVGSTYHYPFVSVDSNGYPFIGYNQMPGVADQYVTKSSTNDGTWATALGFPYFLITDPGGGYTAMVPLTNGKMYAVHPQHLSTVRGWLWDGAAWGVEEVASTSNTGNDLYWTVRSIGDDVHFVFTKAVTFDILYFKRTYGVGWGAEVTVQAATLSTVAPVLCVNRMTGNLICFWAGSPTAKHVYYKKNIHGVWDAGPTDWIDESVQALTGNSRVTCFFQVYRNCAGLVYMTKTASPYNVKLALLTVPAIGGLPLKGVVG